MPSLRFPYITNVYIDPETGDVHYLYRPYVPVQLGYGGTEAPRPADCLLDSGADFNLFPAYLGELVSIPIRSGHLIEHVGIGDAVLRAYRHTVRLAVGEYRFDTTVDFSYDQATPLLGREGFFTHFTDISFRQREHVVELTYSEQEHEGASRN